ncbi:hypothetical protein PV11_08633 [Exophiala sideris]|uniref:HTH APSES-type domain-containing protein n=1 Tax=Exophiala sideris TaxID=1016849 RepID=A0A0D1YDZ2_9EURO|nr:hypothetical protein PV11_08633 [Exophiala sideris]
MHGLHERPKSTSPETVKIKEEWVELSDTDIEMQAETLQTETIEVSHEATQAVDHNVVSPPVQQAISHRVERVMSTTAQNPLPRRVRTGPRVLHNVPSRSSHDVLWHRKASAVPKIERTSYKDTGYLVMNVRGLLVMRRESDSFLNASQITKFAGVEQGRKIRVAEDQIEGEYERIIGGYAPYQGIWVSHDYGRRLARDHNVEQTLLPLLDYDTTVDGRSHPSQPARVPPRGNVQKPGRARVPSSGPKKQVLAPQRTTIPADRPPTRTSAHDRQRSEQPSNALASREEWLDSSESEDELSRVFESEDVDPPRPAVISDVSHVPHPQMNMNSKRKRQSEPQGHIPDEAAHVQKRPKQNHILSEDESEVFHDYSQVSAQLLSRTIRNALLDPKTTTPSSLEGYGHGSRNASIGVGVGRTRKNADEYSTNAGSAFSRSKRERLGELGMWFDRRELADNNAVMRSIEKVRAKVPWDQMSQEEQQKVRKQVKRKIFHQRYQDGRSQSYFISQLLKLANQSGVGNDAILGLLLQQRKSRETLVELFSGLVGVNESGTLSVNKVMAETYDEEGWETE